ncbi:hypothetical protein EW026_g6045 [Hermanssonia centrifuga]|uniref:Chitin-binding type-3 domain-containing protein n=1 Tax=Hermanssonia centrifuga TaxID=98765 RepID=A0A4S4KC77_9APHY|nr:hypothetical protein EW026_g6045 [Hermanssonia centrifuga]
MVYQWEPETQYNNGDVVEFEGHQYQIVQPHRSQSDWTPPVTPALWARLPEQYCQPGQGGGGYNPSYEQPQQQQQQEPVNDGQGKQWDEHEHQKVDIPHEEQKKNWWDLDDKRKHELEVGGGLAAGLGLLGAGYYAYKHHEKSGEEKKAQVWGLQGWLTDAQRRTQEFYQNGPQGPVTWVLVQDKHVPEGAFPAGEVDGEPLYVCRAFHEGSIQVGKVSPRLDRGAVIGYGHNEIHLATYEVLLGDRRAVQWVEAHGHLDLNELGARPVEAGKESNDTPLYIAQAHYHNGIHPGKCSTHLDGAFIPFGNTEKNVSDYRVLCYN